MNIKPGRGRYGYGRDAPPTPQPRPALGSIFRASAAAAAARDSGYFRQSPHVPGTRPRVRRKKRNSRASFPRSSLRTPAEPLHSRRRRRRVSLVTFHLTTPRPVRRVAIPVPAESVFRGFRSVTVTR